MRSFLWALIIVAIGLPVSAQDVIQSDGDRTLVATVFGMSLYLEQLTPHEAKIKRQELTRAEFEEWLRKYRGTLTYKAVWDAVRQKYIESEKLTVTKDELDAIDKFIERDLESEAVPVKYDITPEFRKGMIAWQWASLMDWKVCRSLYGKYGGRVGTGSMGSWIAFDAQNALLREHQESGDIKFHCANIEKAFREHTMIKNFADAYPKGERLRWLLATPPYMQDQAGKSSTHRALEQSGNNILD